MKKTCRKCKVDQDVENFDKSRSNKDGLKNECKDCVRKYNKERYKKGEWLKMIIG